MERSFGIITAVDTPCGGLNTGSKPAPLLWALTWALVALMAALSIALRWPGQLPAASAEAGRDKLYVNQDATWHVLHTMQSYDGIPAAEHLYLPLVTPDDDARGVVWGAAVPDGNGIFYYTSFWTAGFIVPWLFAKLFGLAYVPVTLYIFNSVLYAACCALAALVMARLFKKRLHPCLVAALAAGIYLFQPEILQSQGAVYWHHSLNQLLLLGQLYCFTWFGKPAGRVGFFALCLLCPLVEYTGFVANAGYCLLLLFKGAPGPAAKESPNPAGLDAPSWPKLRWPRRLLLAGGAGALTLAAGGITLFHYTRKLGLEQVLRAMSGSYLVRGDSARDPLLQLLVMYFRSFRYLWLVLGALAVAVLILPAARKALPGMLRAFWPWLLATVFPMLENLLLRQHTVEYSYARMKAVAPLLLVFFMLAACLWQAFKGFAPNAAPRRFPSGRVLGAALALVVLASSALGLGQYLAAPNRYVEVIGYMPRNQALANRLLADYPREESFYGCGLMVRGYTNYLFRGGMMELCDTAAALEETRARGRRYAVWVDAVWGTSNTCEFTSATVMDTATGEETVIESW